ncbi:diacylglycerol kinase family protein [Desulfosporosinus sp. BICA1-9]|uniref:diacylglycerol/lipid kinase family protein n=1 Tax=Desulfosporosinus sp. BICA1-9 TaxID=1531958 RepID=UPI00054B3182|nr:diacylglycerol kinase family protein [Desulfosporosinus sp. BICA1-9]KJS48129.1 MAG: lipid kinase [Peptococcaceae bacterium BRH_c23]KJS78405.1 MAG: lipid kinase [Desulfosporosinus sp. BICA1-9]HBW36570.1 diacylglycerol kinase family lipid kinase [Desulfosporosinus sp.]
MLEKERWYAVVNPKSANGSTFKQWPVYLKRLEEEGYLIQYEYTSGPRDATKITQRILQEGYTHIIAVGGDGTMNEVVNGFFTDGQMINPDAELALFSHGTGGDLIRTLMIPKGIEGFLAILSQRRKRKVDVGEVFFQKDHGQQESRYFINVADVGLGGETVARVNQQSKLLGGKLSFLIGSVISILRYRNKVMRCEIDGKLISEGRQNSIMVANGRFIGGGMMIAPQAELDDGLFDVVCLGDFSTLTLLRHLPKIYRGAHLKIPGVEVYRGQSVVITSTEKALLDIDGEQPGYAPITFTLHPKTLCLWG